MRITKPAFAFALCVLPLVGSADPEGDLRAAMTALSRTSYTWETTTRQRFSGENTEPRLNPNAPIEVRGTCEPNGLTVVTLLPSRALAVPITAVFRQGDAVVQTPIGWLRRTEMRETPDQPVEIDGKQVRLARVFTAGLKAAAQRRPADELFDLIADMKSCRSENGLILVELRDPMIEQLWGDAQAKRAPEIQGTIIFKLSEQGVTEYHFLLAIGFPNSRTNKVAWSMQQWSTRLTAIGSTTVDAPEDAVRALDK
jgi:hypothetical protein